LASAPRPPSKETAADPIHYVDWLTLLGFMPQDEALKLIRTQNVVLTDDWNAIIRGARDVANQVSGRMECRPEVKQVDEKYRDRFLEFKSEPTFKQHSAGMQSMDFALVELSKIHTYQTMINNEYVDVLAKKAPDPDDLEGALKFSLPTESEKPRPQVVTSFNPSTNTFSAVSDNLDLRILANTHAEDPVNHTPIAGFYYGFALPQITVVEFKGLSILKNGYHRACALLRKGHRFLPCLLGKTEMFQVTGAQVPGAFPSSTMFSDKSPILSDFETGAAVLVPRRRVKVMATIHAEVQVVPL